MSAVRLAAPGSRIHCVNVAAGELLRDDKSR